MAMPAGAPLGLGSWAAAPIAPVPRRPATAIAVRALDRRSPMVSPRYGWLGPPRTEAGRGGSNAMARGGRGSVARMSRSCPDRGPTWPCLRVVLDHAGCSTPPPPPTRLTARARLARRHGRAVRLLGFLRWWLPLGLCRVSPWSWSGREHLGERTSRSRSGSWGSCCVFAVVGPESRSGSRWPGWLRLVEAYRKPPPRHLREANSGLETSSRTSAPITCGRARSQLAATNGPGSGQPRAAAAGPDEVGVRVPRVTSTARATHQHQRGARTRRAGCCSRCPRRASAPCRS